MADNTKNKANTLKNIFRIDSDIKANQSLIFQSRQMIEENRSMILNNYTSSFSGNNRLANANTEEIYKNRNAILEKITINNETERKFIEAEKEKANLDFLELQSNLNSTNLEISKDMAEINSKLLEINRKVMEANESIVAFNTEQLQHNQNLLEKKFDITKINEDNNSSIIEKNLKKIMNLKNSEKINQEELYKLLDKSRENSNSLINNRKEILERRSSIMANRETISVNKSKIFYSS